LGNQKQGENKVTYRRRNREQTLSFKEMWRLLEDGVVGIFVGLVIASLGALIVFALATTSNNEAEGNRQIVATQLSSFGKQTHVQTATIVDKRKHEAKEFLTANKLGVNLGAEGFASQFDLSSQEMKSIAHTAKTGVPAQINTVRWQYGNYFKDVYWWPGLPLLVIASCTALFIYYLFERDSRYYYYGEYRLSDLPWKKAWPWVVSFFFGPIGWLVTGIDALYLRKLPALPPQIPAREQPQHREVDGERQPGAEVTHENNIENAPTRRRLPSYNSEPKSSADKYLELRTGSVQRRARKRVGEIDNEIAFHREEAADCAQHVKEIQGSIGELNAEKVRLEASLETTPVLDDPTVITQEFESIMRLPGVLAVQVVNDHLRLILRAQITYKGTDYDLGDWIMNIGDNARFDVTCIRRGQRSDWGGSYPVYRIGGDDTFCFGSRLGVIYEHMSKQQYLEAVALVVEGLSSVNKGDKESIPRAFKPLDK
jgi:hypothetical protein